MNDPRSWDAPPTGAVEMLPPLVDHEPTAHRGSVFAPARPRGTRTFRRSLALVGLTALVTAVLAGPAVSRAVPSARDASERGLAQQRAGATGRVTIRVAFDAAGTGTFAASGAISEAGVASVRIIVTERRVRLTATLRGTSGTLVTRVDQGCGKARGAWRVLAGSGAYAGLSGGGNAAGRIACTRSRLPARVVHTGEVRLPSPPQLATPGTYAGWTAQGERVTFEVLAGGRRLGNVRVERLFATCHPELEVALEPAFPETYPLAEDGSFSLTFARTTIAGRLSGSSAAGAIAYASSEAEPFACTSGRVGWTATSPPPALPRALPGSYCGSTGQARGVCLTLAPDGRIAYLRIEVTLECTRPEEVRFEAVIGFGGRLPLRSNLAFEVLGALDDSASGEYVLRGAFDEAGGVSGTVSLHKVGYDQDGTPYGCRNSSFGWRAKRVT